jgi:hypothetical protein
MYTTTSSRVQDIWQRIVLCLRIICSSVSDNYLAFAVVGSGYNMPVDASTINGNLTPHRY